MSWTWALASATATGAASWLAIGALVRILGRFRVLDHPNERSSHERPTPRGAGLAVIPLFLLAWAVGAYFGGKPLPLAILAAALLLAAVSWLDDLRGLGALPRLLVQLAAVALGLFALGGEGSATGGLLPLWLDRLLLALAWLWFVNLFNFMDGIDGISALEGIAIAAGLLLLSLLLGEGAATPALLLAAVLLGFLYWNRPPARIFLGDVGSVPLGFLLGYLLAEAALAGNWALALILPAYYWGDATLTLLRRAMRGEAVWRSHREHWYQRAAARLGHGAVCKRIGLVNVALVGLALASLFVGPWPALAAAAFLVIGSLWLLGRESRG